MKKLTVIFVIVSANASGMNNTWTSYVFRQERVGFMTHVTRYEFRNSGENPEKRFTCAKNLGPNQKEHSENTENPTGNNENLKDIWWEKSGNGENSGESQKESRQENLSSKDFRYKISYIINGADTSPSPSYRFLLDWQSNPKSNCPPSAQTGLRTDSRTDSGQQSDFRPNPLSDSTPHLRLHPYIGRRLDAALQIQDGSEQQSDSVFDPNSQRLEDTDLSRSADQPQDTDLSRSADQPQDTEQSSNPRCCPHHVTKNLPRQKEIRKKGTKIGLSIRQRILSLYEKRRDLTIKKISKICNVSVSSCQRIISEGHESNRVKYRQPQMNLDSESRKERIAKSLIAKKRAISLYKKRHDLTVQQIALLCGISWDTLKNVISREHRENGLKLRCPRKSPTAEPNNKKPKIKKKANPVDSNIKQKAIYLYENRKDINLGQIARMCGISRAIFLNIIREGRKNNGIKLRCPKQSGGRIDPNIKQKVIYLYENRKNLTLKQIAHMCGMSWETIRGIVSRAREANSIRMRRPRIDPAVKKKALDLYRENEDISVQEIAQTCGISPSSVYALIQSMRGYELTAPTEP